MSKRNAEPHPVNVLWAGAFKAAVRITPGAKRDLTNRHAGHPINQGSNHLPRKICQVDHDKKTRDLRWS